MNETQSHSSPYIPFHWQDHKKGLIPDKLVHPRVELPKARRGPSRTQGGVSRREIPVVSDMLISRWDIMCFRHLHC